MYHIIINLILFAFLAEDRALRWFSIASVLSRAHTNNFRVDCCRDAVVYLSVELGKSISCMNEKQLCK